jgi:hypothetical protein
VSGEQFQVSPLDADQPHAVAGAPAGEQAQVGGVADQGVAGVAGQEPGDGDALREIGGIVVAHEHRSSG